MRAREKRLALIFGSLLVVLPIAGGALKFVKSSDVGLGTQSITRKLREVKTILESKDLWESRDLWMAENVPSYSSESVASAKLLERIAEITRDHGVQIESQEIIKIDPEQDSDMGRVGYFNRVELSVELSGDKEKIVKCIHEIQTPQYFSGIDSLVIESTEQEGLKYQLLITQWYLSAK